MENQRNFDISKRRNKRKSSRICLQNGISSSAVVQICIVQENNHVDDYHSENRVLEQSWVDAIEANSKLYYDFITKLLSTKLQLANNDDKER